MTFGSLFAGIGGFDLGFERAGMECKWQVEIDEYCQRVLQKHWPDVRRWGDIKTFPPDNSWGVDCVVGGFPCQDISYAGAGAGLEGERSGLFFEAMRVVRELGPRFVVLENVAALLTRGLPEVLGTLASLGYDTEWHCLQAADFGAPHIRDRVFVVAHHSGLPMEKHPLYDSSGLQRKFRGNWDAQARTHWKADQPGFIGVAHGVPSRVDRLRGLGNAVVPQVAEFIGRMIMESRDGSTLKD